jgi:hypothetical protein
MSRETGAALLTPNVSIGDVSGPGPNILKILADDMG